MIGAAEAEVEPIDASGARQRGEGRRFAGRELDPAAGRQALLRKGAARGGGGELFPSLARHQTLEESAYRDIRRAIVEGRFAPGQRIVATVVAQATGVSRVPVMQALRRLEAAGFVRLTPHKDVVVTGLSPAEFRERFLLMAALESLCVRESAGKITPALRARLHALQKEMAA